MSRSVSSASTTSATRRSPLRTTTIGSLPLAGTAAAGWPSIVASDTIGTGPSAVGTVSRPAARRIAPTGVAAAAAMSAIGMATTWPPTVTSSARVLEGDGGQVSVKVVPRPSAQSTSTRPWIRSTADRTMSSPTPRPEIASASVTGGRAALEQHPHQVVPRRGVGLSADCQPRADRGLVEPRPIVGHGDAEPLPAQLGGHTDASPARLAEPLANRGELDAVVHGVPEQLEERLAQSVEDRAVRLDASIRDLQRDLLARGGGEIARGSRQGLARFTERAHAQPADLVQHAIRDLTDRARVLDGVGREAPRLLRQRGDLRLHPGHDLRPRLRVAVRSVTDPASGAPPLRQELLGGLVQRVELGGPIGEPATGHQELAAGRQQRIEPGGIDPKHVVPHVGRGVTAGTGSGIGPAGAAGEVWTVEAATIPAAGREGETARSGAVAARRSARGSPPTPDALSRSPASAERIGRGEEQLEVLRLETPRPVPGLDQQRLQVVADLLDQRHVRRPRGTLQRVGHAEQRLEARRIGRARPPAPAGRRS